MQNMQQQTSASQQVHATVIHIAEVARVVQVQVQIDVVGPDEEVHPIFIQQAEPGQRMHMLPDGQRRDANETDEMHLKSFADSVAATGSWRRKVAVRTADWHDAGVIGENG